jgi:hypothetical protein
MGSIEQAWREAGERFARLGHELRASYDRQAASEGGPSAGTGGGATDRQAVEDGLRKLVDALDHMATMAGATVRDPEVGTSARLAARSLGDAIAATLDGVSQEPRGQHGDRRAGDRAEPRPPDAGNGASPS